MQRSWYNGIANQQRHSTYSLHKHARSCYSLLDWTSRNTKVLNWILLPESMDTMGWLPLYHWQHNPTEHRVQVKSKVVEKNNTYKIVDTGRLTHETVQYTGFSMCGLCKTCRNVKEEDLKRDCQRWHAGTNRLNQRETNSEKSSKENDWGAVQIYMNRR